MPTRKQRNKKIITYIVGAAFIAGFFFLLNYLGEKNSDGDSASTNQDVSGGNFSGDATQVQSGDWLKGNKSANVSIIEYGDFQCPACGSYAPIVKQVMDKYGDKIKLAYRHFPLTQIHPFAVPAAYASEAAGNQGKFWEMHDILYDKQREWSAGHSGSANNFFLVYAGEIGLDTDKFAEDLQSDGVRKKVKDQLASANRLGLNSTPSFLLNGEQIQIPRSLEDFSLLIEAALENAPPPSINKEGLSGANDVHEHADFAVYLNGNKFDFSQDKYQSDEPVDDQAKDSGHDPYTHAHNNDGNTIHKHKEGVSVGYFFETLGMEFFDECFVTDSSERFCSDENNSLKFFVNGTRKQNGSAYVFNDLDQILISYGPLLDDNLQTQLSSVSDTACIYSEKCPERGPAPEENCVGGLGTTCGI